MKAMVFRAAMFGALPALILSAPACGANNDPCAKFEEPLAYNACLARQGPQAHGAKATRDVGGHGTVAARRGPHGRERMEFTITPR
jgi:hypothetical protein